MAAHPESTRQGAWLNSHPGASYAGVGYWGVHSFTFTNGNGDTALVKYKAIPDAGELGLTDEEAEAKGANFYEEELKERLSRARSRLSWWRFAGATAIRRAIRRSDGTEDGRERTKLGKISVEGLRPTRPAMRSPSCPAT